MVDRRSKTRRQFMRDTGLVAASATMGACFPEVGGRWPGEFALCEPLSVSPPAISPRVVAAHDPASVLVSGRHADIQAGPVAQMLADAMAGITDDATSPWAEIFPEYDSSLRIGIKVNCLNQSCPTSVELVQAIVESLKAELGIPSERLLVWDRRLDELTRCGFTEQSVGATVIGTINSYQDQTGPGYEEEVCTVIGDQTARLSRILTQETDLTINVPVLKTHGISGITAAMKNMYGVIHNPEDFHDNHNEAMPAIYNLGPVRERMRFTVLDAFKTVTIGGTSSPMDTVGHRLAVSRDAVALDAYALTLVNQLREEKNLGLPAVDATKLAWIDKAETLELGTRIFDLTLK